MLAERVEGQADGRRLWGPRWGMESFGRFSPLGQHLPQTCRICFLSCPAPGPHLMTGTQPPPWPLALSQSPAPPLHSSFGPTPHSSCASPLLYFVRPPPCAFDLAGQGHGGGVFV